MNTNTAIHMIQDHGHKAFATADGLLAMSSADAYDDFGQRIRADIEHNAMYNIHAMIRARSNEYNALVEWHTSADVVFEESTVFEVRDDGTVDSAAIRRWLGY